MNDTSTATQRANVNIHSQDVTPEQIEKCTKLYDFATGTNFYLVENSRGETNDECQLIEYKVSWTREYGFQCTCPSGKNGFSGVKHSSGVCWHVRACVSAAREEHAVAIGEKRECALLINNKPATQEEYDRVMNAVPKKNHQGARVYQGRAFSLLR